MLEALRDIEIASEFLGSKNEGTEEEDPLDAHYKKLHCNILPIPHDSADFKMVEKYLKQTHAPTHTVYTHISDPRFLDAHWFFTIKAILYLNMTLDQELVLLHKAPSRLGNYLVHPWR